MFEWIEKKSGETYGTRSGLTKIREMIHSHKTGARFQSPDTYVCTYGRFGRHGVQETIYLDAKSLDAHYLMGYCQGYFDSDTDRVFFLDNLKKVCVCTSCKRDVRNLERKI